MDTQTIIKYATVLIIGFAGWFISGMVANTVRRRSSHIVKSKHYRNIFAVISQTAIITIVVIFILDILDLGATAASLAAGAGIVGIIIGYGSQRLFKEATAAAIIFFKNQFRVGDWVKIGKHTGKITSIGFKGVSLITTMSESLFLPATTVIDKPIINYTRKTSSAKSKELWRKVTVTVYPSKVAKVKEFALTELKKDPKITATNAIASEIKPRKSYQTVDIDVYYKAEFNQDLHLKIVDQLNSFCANLKQE